MVTPDPPFVVALVGEPGPRGWERLRQLPSSVGLVDARIAEPASLAAARALLVWDFRWRTLASLLPELPALSWIHTASAGVDHILDPAILDAGILVTNSAGIFDRPIAEYVLGLVLAHAKGLVDTLAAQRARRWAYRETRDVHDQVMVVVGLGHVGRAVAHLAGAVGMQVIGVRSTGAPIDGIEVVPPTGLPDVLGRADYVVVTAALTPETKGLIGRLAFNAMKPSAYLINVARGAIVDTAALLDALGRGTIAGAALDVFDHEPVPPDSPLWTASGLLVSPHMSGDSEGWVERVVELFATNVERFLRGEPLLNAVDQARGY